LGRLFPIVRNLYLLLLLDRSQWALTVPSVPIDVFPVENFTLNRPINRPIGVPSVPPIRHWPDYAG
jgi:hypothetical protein